MGGKHFLVNHGPGVKEDDLDIKENEEHGDELEFEGEPGAAGADGEHAALVSGVLDGKAFAAFAEDDGADEHPGGKEGREGEEHQYGQIFQLLRTFHEGNARKENPVGKPEN